jgi:hypothetical protein
MGYGRASGSKAKIPRKCLGFAPDMFQLGGDFLVDKQGTLAFAYRMRNNGDRVDTGTLVEGLARLADGQ